MNSSATITLHDKTFSVYVGEKEIESRIEQIASQITEDYIRSEKTPLLLPILNGAFMFAAALGKKIKTNVEFHFVKIASYQGIKSTNTPTNHIGVNPKKIKGKDIIIVEDVLDTGKTLSAFKKSLESYNAASVKLACLFRKPKAMTHSVEVDYLGLDIENQFVVGYGLDYDGLGRNLCNLYQLVEKK